MRPESEKRRLILFTEKFERGLIFERPFLISSWEIPRIRLLQIVLQGNNIAFSMICENLGNTASAYD